MSRDSHGRGKTARQLAGGRHIIMGLVLMLFAYVLVQYRTFGTIPISQTTAYITCGFIVAYGIFRIWRGFVTLRNNGEED